MDRKNILYIGGFILPDKNAAALRVIANAKALRDLGYNIIFLNSIPNYSKPNAYKKYYGFECYECKRSNLIKYLLNYKNVKKIIEKENIDIVIAYNYPAIALNSLRKYCKKNNIICIADVTEWYVPTGNLVFCLAKGFDSEFRMRYVHKKLDGIIAISDYLYKYYYHSVNTVKIPPLIDLKDDKWNSNVRRNEGILKIVYAGQISAQKERIDLIIDLIEKTRLEIPIHLNIIGITEQQYNDIYNKKYLGTRVSFLGRISNQEVIDNVKNSDWSIIIRDNNKVVQAGFPTKIAESITCNTPVIANKFSNILDYLNETNSIIINDINDIDEDFLNKCLNLKNDFDSTIFDYRNFLGLFNRFLKEMGDQKMLK